jgi:hypothetical protein
MPHIYQSLMVPMIHEYFMYWIKTIEQILFLYIKEVKKKSNDFG